MDCSCKIFLSSLLFYEEISIIGAGVLKVISSVSINKYLKWNWDINNNRLTFYVKWVCYTSLCQFQIISRLWTSSFKKTTIVNKPYRPISFALPNSCQIQSLKDFQKVFKEKKFNSGTQEYKDTLKKCKYNFQSKKKS